MTNQGTDKRKHPRVMAHFIVSYRILDKSDSRDITQTKNLSLGGMLLTTNRQFDPGTNLALEIRLPFDPNPIMLVGKVIESKQITKNLIYDTRITFQAIDEKHRTVISDTVSCYLRKDEPKKK
ncbi:MAG: PilZ domain-containing protein [Candidatus Omnitrophica bacterium]|nr:PilZ domain-containing protein [Candidatus Omnitrophota bacterium]